MRTASGALMGGLLSPEVGAALSGALRGLSPAAVESGPSDERMW
ncbi:hypothetical protein B005_1914 [Nocardiopsis alba ATCC BAA-2165]|uniref:Uncharacterized protein n=1 Tax=Nocardiopsis alba (strain ATCC BAA-2165 / BE74) TaxID=1205910 RepID=J7LEF8_NOCAA|nr:hypothetical protein B005_1914 [Nocardiopsis alba ATCC BAA-2165]